MEPTKKAIELLNKACTGIKEKLFSLNLPDADMEEVVKIFLNVNAARLQLEKVADLADAVESLRQV